MAPKEDMGERAILNDKATWIHASYICRTIVDYPGTSHKKLCFKITPSHRFRAIVSEPSFHEPSFQVEPNKPPK